MNETDNQDAVVKLLREQNDCMKKQLRLMRIVSVIILIVGVYCAVYIFSLIPKVEKIVTQVDGASKNLELVTDSLSEADLPASVEKINKLMETSEFALADAAENMNKIDFDTLNTAIRDLQKVVEPLANLFR